MANKNNLFTTHTVNYIDKYRNKILKVMFAHLDDNFNCYMYILLNKSMYYLNKQWFQL